MIRVDLDELRSALRKSARAAGFDDIGYCSARPFDRWREVAGEAVKARLSHDPGEVMAGAESIVVAVRRYGVFEDWPEGMAEVSNYYTRSAEGFESIGQVAGALAGRGFRAVANPRLPAKQAAVRAGLGVQGMNTQFCHREFGALVSLHMVLTDAPLAAGDAEYRSCGQCGLCARACPTGAIAPRSFERERCLRQHMLGGDAVPRWMRGAMGVRLLGCTDCQHACPRAQRTPEEGIPPELMDACRIEGLLNGDAGQMEALERLVGPNFVRPARVRRQAAIVAGNSGNRDYVPALTALLNQQDEILRGHAAWALGKLGGEDARSALRSALEGERDERVREEIESALNRETVF